MAYGNKKYNVGVKFTLSLLVCALFSTKAEQVAQVDSGKSLGFEHAIKLAQKNDPWITGNVHKQRAIEAMSQAVNTLPDPKVSISLANLPVNGFDFSQEGMTQAKVGVSQMFPRGESLAIKSQQLKTQSEALPYQRMNREGQVAVTVGSLWLDAYRVQESIALIEKNSALFEQLAEVAQASYSSALGKTRQQDIVRAQLELTRLEDRLNQLAEQKSRYHGMLLQWLSQLSDQERHIDYTAVNVGFSLDNMQLSQQLPSVALLDATLVLNNNWLKRYDLVPYFLTHPSVMALDKNIAATKTGIKLAEQKYQPEWGVNASYGYRDDDPMGRSRADFFSVGVTFDVPLFTANRQDKELQSAVSEAEAIKSEKTLLLRQLVSSYSSAKARLLRLHERQSLYKLKLLPQVHDQAEASLSAYTNDDGDFAEVVRSRIAVLNTEIDELTLNVETQKLHLTLNYLLMGQLNATHSSNKMHKNKSQQFAVVYGEKS